MYQCEAMWLYFEAQESHAIKISTGGINALTGRPREAVSSGRQDYLAIKEFGEFETEQGQR